MEIRPLVRGPRAALALSAAAASVLGAAFYGGSHLADAWEAGLRAGSFAAGVPLPLLFALTATVGVSTPLALLGLAALSFSEEEVLVERDYVTVARTSFERTRVTRIPRSEIAGWRETWRPLSPWWTWTVTRLAVVRSQGGLLPLAPMAGPKEKRRVALVLARATGLPLTDPLGRPVAGDPAEPPAMP
ncbi:MAG TPA: hypothetical protein VIE39_03415 [Thermoanaerobaculia bacterium]